MFSDCKCCEAYKKQIEHLQGLLDRTLNLIAPRVEQGEPETKETPQQDAVKYGD